MKKIWKNEKGCVLRACILSAVLLVLVGLAVKAEGPEGYFLPLGIILAAAAGAYQALKLKFGRVLNVISVLLLPVLSVYCLQFYTCDPWKMYPMMAVLNCVFCYLFYLFLSFALGSFRWGYALASVFLMVVGIANYFVVEFRSSPIVPWDLLSVGTAASVADNYTYTISWRLFFVSVGFIFIILTAMKNTITVKRKKIRIPGAVLSLVLLAASVAAIQEEDVKNFFGMDQTLFTPNVRYRNNGFVAAFLGNLYLINVQEPDGYSVEKVEEIQDSIEEKRAEDDGGRTHDVTAASEEYPNIVVIMNEAFSDLSVLGEFGTNEDYMPFFRSLMEDYPSGQLMVSVKGGNTANTEYEFLTGDTMAFLPSGSVVYQQYIHNDITSFPSYLKGLGYSTTAIHPYLASGWGRDVVYPRLGFDEFIDIESFSDASYIRNYVSDESAFEKIREIFEDPSREGRKFIFEVTMQNHSGYSKDYPGFEPVIKLTDFSQTSTSIRAAEKYLTLIKESDTAFENLISYFESLDEPTVVIMFGDHQPSDYITNVISRVTGYDGEASLEEYQKSFLVPYVIWNNCGLEEDGSMELTSVNYLASWLVKQLGMPSTDYQEFLMSIREQLPVICAGAYIDSTGTYHSWSEKDDTYDSILNEYNILQYNHLTDSKHQVSGLFWEMPETGLTE